MVGQEMFVRWRQHQIGMLGYLRHLLASEVFVDVTLCCQGKRLKAHRVLLSACSPYLQELLTAHPSSEHTTIILDDISYDNMRFLLDFVYTGGVTVPEEKLPAFLDAAQSLHITALTNKHLHQQIPARTPPALIKVPQDRIYPNQSCRQFKDPHNLGLNGYKNEYGPVEHMDYDIKSNGTDIKPIMRHDEYALKTEHKIPSQDILVTSPKHSPNHGSPILDCKPCMPSPRRLSPIPNCFNGLNKCDTSSSGSSPSRDNSDFQWARPLPSLMPISASTALNQRRLGIPVTKHPRKSLGGILTPSPWAQNGRPQAGAPRVVRSPSRVVERNVQSDEFDQSESRLVASPSYIPPESNGLLHGSPRFHDSSKSDGDSSSEPPSILRENDENRPDGVKLCGLKERRLQEFYREQILSNGTSLKVPQEEVTELPFKQPLLLEKIQRYSEQPYHFTNKLHHISRILGADNGSSYRADVNPLHGLKTLASLLEDNSNSSNSSSSDPPGVQRRKSLSCSDLTENTTRNDSNNNEGATELTPVGGLRCEDCGKMYEGLHQLQQHRESQDCLSCLPCGKQFQSRNQWLDHQKQHDESRQEHACTHCTKTFITRASLKVHLRTHTGEKPFHCLECGKQFSQLRNYKYHRSVHEGTREFAATCPECGKYFNDRGYLSSHMKIHRNRKEYGCEYCGKSFNQRVAYNMHVRIHTGEKPHVCPHCNKSFSRKMLLKQHLRIHTGEKPFTCVVCQKAFADRSNMTLHMRLHSGVKPYTCTVCSKSFTKKHHLKTHMNYHTGVKPYACSKCGIRFSQSSNMRTHFKKCSSTAYPDISQPSPQANNLPLNMTLNATPNPSDDSSNASSVLVKDAV